MVGPLQHVDCEGKFQPYVIPEHHYCFMKCSACGQYLSFFSDGENVREHVNKLMLTKVSPTIRRV